MLETKKQNEIGKLEAKLEQLYDEATEVVLEILDLNGATVEPGCGVKFLPRRCWPCGYHGDGQERDLSVLWPIQDMSEPIRKPLDRELEKMDEEFRKGEPDFTDLLRGRPVVDSRESMRLQFRPDDLKRKPKSARHAVGLRFASSRIGLEHFRQRKIDFWDEKALLSYLDRSQPGWERADILREKPDQGPVIEDF